MEVRLYINNIRIELADTAITQTKQVNDLASMQNRQTNYTNAFNVPKTPNNVAAFDFLGVPGNTSNIPYQKNEASYYEADFCHIYKGWATVTETDEVYKVFIYDGNLDLYKAIENKTLSHLNLTELDHIKTLQTVSASWNANSPYRYILADYNGKTTYAGNRINIDYLVPSVNVKYLWDKVFSTFGYTYSGSVFTTEAFTNLWLTYPKGLASADAEQEVFKSSDYGFAQSSGGATRTYYARYNSFETFGLVSATNAIHLKVNEGGTYRIELSGTITAANNFNVARKSKIYLGKNTDVLPAHQVSPFVTLADEVASDTEFSASGVFNLNPQESISIVLSKASSEGSGYVIFGGSLSVRLVKVNASEYDFKEALIDFSIKDFLQEILQRFGLTLFKDRYANNYTFLTLQEQLQLAQTEDWSDRFIKTLSEKYIYGNYARVNLLEYSYNDKEGSYNNGALLVDNINLPDSKVLIKSKIYSPEKEQQLYFGKSTNVYKFWEKEFTDQGGTQQVEYKPLNKRFYFLRSENRTFSGGIIIGSEALGTSATITTAPAESFAKLAFTDVVQEYYMSLQNILNKAKIISVQLFFSSRDIADFDFKKLYYIAQLSGYFLVNKISGYTAGKPATVELVQVNRNE